MVAIVPYEARWPGEFDRIATELRSALGTPTRFAYAEVKDPAVDLIYFAAEAWAASSGWNRSAEIVRLANP